MNKKGFVFVETIIVVTVLASSLLMVYATFTTVLSSEKRRVMFDDPAYIYRTYYLENFLVSLNMDQYVSKYLSKTDPTKQKIIELNCGDISLYNAVNAEAELNGGELKKRIFCEDAIKSTNNKLNVKHIFITFYDITDFKSCTTKTGKISNNATCKEYRDALKNINVNMIYYIRTLTGTGQGYRIIVEYEETELDKSNAKNPVNGNCGTNYQIDGNKCYRKITKNYFNNVIMVPRGDISE